MFENLFKEQGQAQPEEKDEKRIPTDGMKLANPTFLAKLQTLDEMVVKSGAEAPEDTEDPKPSGTPQERNVQKFRSKVQRIRQKILALGRLHLRTGDQERDEQIEDELREAEIRAAAAERSGPSTRVVHE